MLLRKWSVVFVMCFLANKAFTQQMVLGKNPYAMSKSAVLELNADNQGLLLPRISDTASINSLNPPDGMVIYFVPTRRLLLRTSGYWSTLAPSSSAINMTTGSTGTDVNISGSPVSLDGTVTLNLPSASASARGLLTSTDWSTFNSKVSATRTINTTAPLNGGGDLSTDRTLSMTQANATTNGWLSSTDWNTFNNKQSAGNYLTGLSGDVSASGPGTVAATIANNAVTNAKIRQSAALSVVGNATNATANVTDITAANDGEVLRRSGTTIGFGQVATAGITNSAVTYAKMQNVSASNRLLGRATSGAGAVEEITIGTGLTLSGTTLSANNVSGTLNYVPKFTSTTTLGNSLIYDNSTNVGISTTSPTQKLDVNGNMKFSGALMPAGDPGTDGFVLRSRGAGTAPDWYDLNTFFTSAWTANGNTFGNEKNFGTRNAEAIPFITNDIERMRLTNTGFLGIKTATPGNFLEVAGTTTATGVSGLRLTSMGTATAGTYNNKLLSVNSSGDVIITNGPNAVTSVGLSLPSIFTVTNSPVTTSGTLTGALASQTQNLVFAAPNGSAGTPLFRSLVKADLPSSVVHTDQANTYTAGMKQTFRGSATTAGVSFGGSLTADPTTLAAGDLWYRLDAGKLKYYDGATAKYLATEGSTISGTANYVSKFTPDGNTIGNSQIVDNGTNVGVATASPNTTLDINGDLAMRTGSYTATIGQNNNIIISDKKSFIRVVGPTTNFTITGIAGGVEGKVLILFNSTQFDLTISIESTSSLANNRIVVGSGLSTVLLNKYGTITLLYSGTDSRWVVISKT